MGDYLADAQEWAIAYHEAGHAIAAELCGVRWTSVAIFPDDGASGVHGVTRPLPGQDSPDSSWAFIAWAGAWAQARYTGEDLSAVQQESGDADLGTVGDVVADEDAWSLDLELHWGEIEALAERLVRAGGVLYADDGERIERDMDELVYPAVEQDDLPS